MPKPGAEDKVYPVVKIAMILESLAAEGVATEAIFARLRLSKSAVSSPQARVSLNQILECCCYADQHTHDPHFAYYTGLRFHVSAFGIFGFAIFCSTDFRKATRFASQYQQLATPLGETQFKEEGEYGVWTFAPLPHPLIDGRLYRFLVELQFGNILTIHRDVMGSAFTARELHVTYDAPEDAAAYPEIFGCRVLFGQIKNEFRFDAAWLDEKPQFGNEINYSMSVALCDALMEELRLGIGLAGQVRHFLLANQMRPVRFNDVANHLNISARTLRRKLREESTSYRKVVDDLRMDLAIKYLRDTNLTVEDIAGVLAFSEVANFRQAFRRWTNQAPNQFRGISGAPRP